MGLRPARLALRGFAALCGLALAAQNAPDALIDFMYAKFAATFTRPDGSAGAREFLVLANPGIGLDPSGLKTPSYEISLLLDQVPMVSRAYHPSGNQYSVIYKRILDVARVTRYQASASREAALKARRMLFDRSRPGRPTPEYAAYQRYRAEYDAAQDARSLALEAFRNSGKPVPPGLDQAVETARKRWESLGYKAPIQRALDACQRAYDSNALVMFGNLNREFQNAQLHGISARPWLPVTTYPPVEQWMTGSGWHSMSFRQEDLQRALPAGAAAPPPDRAGPDRKPQASWSRSMVLTVEVKRVGVTRPWMDGALFGARSWTLPDSAGFTRVSTGHPADRNPGPMPVLVTGLLLARKLALTGYAPEASAPARVPGRLGPFNLSGTRSGLPGLRRRQARTPDGIAITVPDPHIVAVFCQAGPMSPNPDPRLFR